MMMKQFTTTPLAVVLVAALSAAGGVLAHSGGGHPHVAKRVGDLNGTITTNASIADDHIPIFKAATCVCPTPICDSRMNAAGICGCQQAAKLACYISSQGACEKPADNACGSST